MNKQPAISVDFISFSYTTNEGDVLPLFSDFSIAVSSGEVLAILGPSGCGKTTLLNLIAGLLEPKDGAVTVCGGNPSRKRASLGIAYAFFSSPLLPHLTLLDNIALPSRLLNLKDPIGRASELIQELGLSGFEKSFPFELSAGMRARAGFAAALATEPRVLLLDEPHGALDAITRESVNNIIRSVLVRRREVNPMTVVLATHSISEARQIADRCMILSNARPVQCLSEIRISKSDVSSGRLQPMPGVEGQIHDSLLKAQQSGRIAIVDPNGETAAGAALPSWSSRGSEVVLIHSPEEWPESGAGAIVYLGRPSPDVAGIYAARAPGRCYAVMPAYSGEPGRRLSGWETVDSLEEGLKRAKGLWRQEGKRNAWAWAAPVLLGVGWVVAVVLVWMGATSFFRIQHFLLPPPADVLAYAVSNLASLAIDTAQTGSEAILGLAIAICFAFLTGVLVDRVKWVDTATWPLLVASQAVPLLAVAPLIHLWLPGLAGIVMMVTLLTFFPLAVSFRAGLNEIPSTERMMFALYTQSWWDTFVGLKLPRSLPIAMAGLRTAAPIAVIAAILAELTGTDRGLGKNFLLAVKKLEPELLFASLAISVMLGLVFYGASVLVRQILLLPQDLAQKSEL